MEHTTGMWKIHTDGIVPRYSRYITGDKGQVVCRIQESFEEKENAFLISSAPELLEACKAIAELANGQGRANMIQVAGMAARAIARAEGR